MAAQFLKGALVSFTPTFVGTAPNVIVFQYNPETIAHAWTAAAGGASPSDPKAASDPLAVRGVPGEQFTFSLSLDATDMIADASHNPVAGGLAIASGVYTRLAALEMLQFPSQSFKGGLLGTVSSAASAAAAGVGGDDSKKNRVPDSDVPTVLFVWGPQRIVPVRVTNLSITEKLYDRLLNPTHADVSITLRVLTPEELVSVKGVMAALAKAAYVYTQGLRQAQAAANLGDAAAAVIGMLPNPF